MARYSIEDTTLTNIANAIRTRTNKTNPIDVADMADEIGGIEVGGGNMQTKTVTPTTSQQNVTPDSGYDGLSKVTVNAMPTATQATPSITVSSGGLITASSTQSAGYVTSGTKSATKQLTVQAAQTITPSTSDKTITSGRYLTGTQTIKGDANLKAENIKNGVSIFGVSGSYEGSGGGSGSGSVETCTVTIGIPGVGYLRNIMITQYIDGVFSTYMTELTEQKTMTFENVVCNTGIGFATNSMVIPTYSVSGGASYNYHENTVKCSWYFTAPSTANASATITVIDDD